MSVSSLTRFTVPLAADQSASAQGLLMPKLQYRFRVTFENFGVSTPRSELTKQVMDFKRPSNKTEEKAIHAYNSIVYIAGKTKWDATSATLRDDATGTVSKLVGEQLQKQFDHMEQASASSGIDYKFITRLEMLDGGNGAHEVTILETWEMYGCWLTSADYGETNYTSDDPVTIKLGIRFDNALQVDVGGDIGPGVGVDIGRTTGDVITG